MLLWPMAKNSMHLKCPTCEITLTQRWVGGEQVDQCDDCQGTWYDESELSSILRNTAGQASAKRSSTAPPSTISCPQCSVKISATIYANDSGIPICKCAQCKGTWLVEGQLAQIALFRNGPHKTDRLAQAMADSYAKSAKFKKYVGLLQSRLYSFVFAAIILAVAFLSRGLESSFRLLPWLVFSLACIWFSNEMGRVTRIGMGFIRPRITQTTPGIAMALGGWILMFAVLGIRIYGAFVR